MAPGRCRKLDDRFLGLEPGSAPLLVRHEESHHASRTWRAKGWCRSALHTSRFRELLFAGAGSASPCPTARTALDSRRPHAVNRRGTDPSPLRQPAAVRYPVRRGVRREHRLLSGDVMAASTSARRSSPRRRASLSTARSAVERRTGELSCSTRARAAGRGRRARAGLAAIVEASVGAAYGAISGRSVCVTSGYAMLIVHRRIGGAFLPPTLLAPVPDHP